MEREVSGLQEDWTTQSMSDFMCLSLWGRLEEKERAEINDRIKESRECSNNFWASGSYSHLKYLTKNKNASTLQGKTNTSAEEIRNMSYLSSASLLQTYVTWLFVQQGSVTSSSGFSVNPLLWFRIHSWSQGWTPPTWTISSHFPLTLGSSLNPSTFHQGLKLGKINSV